MSRVGPSEKVVERGEVDDKKLGTASVARSSRIGRRTPIESKITSRKKNMIAQIIAMMSHL